MKNNDSGNFAESIARAIFLLKGYTIVEKNYVTGKGTTAGEIDFIAKRGKTLVFVEVKNRKNLEDAYYAISENQKQRIINGAKSFISRNQKYTNFDMRFDAVLVKLPFTIKHIKNAWES